MVHWQGEGNSSGAAEEFHYTELLTPGWTRSQAYAINNWGTVVGWGFDESDPDFSDKGYIYRNGHYTSHQQPGRGGRGRQEELAAAANDACAVHASIASDPDIGIGALATASLLRSADADNDGKRTWVSD